MDPVWTFIGGSLYPDEYGVYGPIGTPGPSYTPGGRSYAGYWLADDGTMWIFGGKGKGATSLTEGLFFSP